MNYIVRINPRAVDPRTHQIDERRIWEVEQEKNKDSERVIWHCNDVKIDDVPIQQIFKFPKPGEKPTEMKFSGICVRCNDDAIGIFTKGRHEVQ